MQQLVCIEEMSELTKELSKSQRGEDNRAHVAEEIADVEIMLAQMKIIFNCSEEVEEWKDKKLQRLAGRIGYDKPLL